jgi:hypothetical protein
MTRQAYATGSYVGHEQAVTADDGWRIEVGRFDCRFTLSAGGGFELLAADVLRTGAGA